MATFRPRAPIVSAPPPAQPGAAAPPAPTVARSQGGPPEWAGSGCAYARAGMPDAIPPTPAPPPVAMAAPQPPPVDLRAGFAYARAAFAAASASTLIDTFTGVSGTSLTAHTPDAGGSWTQHVSLSTDTAAISSAGRARANTGSDTGCLLWWSGTPASADYAVSADMIRMTVSGSAAVCGRVDTTSETYYFARLNGNAVTLDLGKRVAGSETILATFTFAAGLWVIATSIHTILLSMQGTLLSAWMDGALLLAASDSAIAATGRVGIALSAEAVVSPDAKQVQLDNLTLGPALDLPPMPRTAQLARGVDAPPHPGWAFADAALPDAIPPSPHAPWPVVAAAEAPRPHPGWAWSDSAPGSSILVAPSRAILARAEAPPPYPGSAYAEAGMPVAVPQVAVPARIIVAAAEPPRPDPGSAYAAHYWPTVTPQLPTATAVLVARAEAPPPHPGSAYAEAGTPLPPPPATPPVLARAEAPPPDPGAAIALAARFTPVPFFRPAQAVVAAAEPPRPEAGRTIGSSVRYVSTPQFATPRRSFVVSAEPPRPYPGHVVVRGRSGGPTAEVVGLLYRIYSNTGAGDPIDYASVIATTDALTWTSGVLTGPAVWKFGVRVLDLANSLEERNVDAVVTLRLDAGAVDVTAIPDAPANPAVVVLPGGGLRLSWLCPTPAAGRSPTGFKVYATAGGVVSYASVAATVAYTLGKVRYAADLAGLAAGPWTLAVRAYNAAGTEAGTATVAATVDTTAPDTVDSLTITGVGVEPD